MGKIQEDAFRISSSSSDNVPSKFQQQ